MKTPGQIVLFEFPNTNLHDSKLRPALLIAKLPGEFDDWLVCMISSQLQQTIDGFDEIISADAPDFSDSGLKKSSVLRISRLAVMHSEIMLGSVGKIDTTRLQKIKTRLSAWINQ